MCNDAPLFSNHSLISFLLSPSKTSTQNLEVIDVILFLFLILPTINSPVAPFSQLLHSPLKWIFWLFLFLFHLFSFLQISDALWPYFEKLVARYIEQLALFNLFLHSLVIECSPWVLVYLFLFVYDQLCFPEPTNFFLCVFVCRLWDVDIARHSHRFLLFRLDIKNVCLHCILIYFIFCLDILEP